MPSLGTAAIFSVSFSMDTIYPVLCVTFNIDGVAAIRLDAVDCTKGTRDKMSL